MSKGLNLRDDKADHHYERRHSQWYEILLLNRLFQWLAGLCVVLVAPAAWFWGREFWLHLDAARTNTVWVVGICFAIIILVLHRLSRFSGGQIMANIMPIVSGVFLLAFAALFFSRSSYSRAVLMSAYVLSLLWCYLGYYVGGRYRRLKVALLPMDPPCDLEPTPTLEIRHLTEPDLQGVRYDAVVADLRGASMTPAWERFLAQCILAHIPVFNVSQVMESQTGRVRIDHLSENEVGALIPSQLYTVCKRLFDIIAVLITLPLTLPLMILTALAIRLDSAGPALFAQDRVGLGNRDFRIYKFRSMYQDAESEGARMASADDERITRVGAFIRRVRLDELPQLWNVLVGDMSLIGPRPEQRVFVDQFDAEIPFYIYRHVVRPGITGWAQVMQGYVNDADATRVKIQHDFYYIKYFSLWLDILILFKTVRIVLTGWGAR